MSALRGTTYRDKTSERQNSGSTSIYTLMNDATLPQATKTNFILFRLNILFITVFHLYTRNKVIKIPIVSQIRFKVV